jgi:hypothetical protein
MKIITFFTLILFSLSTMAETPAVGQWYPIVTCDNGAMVIDRAITGVSGSYRSYSTQLVIRDLGIVNWFISHGAAYSTYNSSEVIFNQLSPRFDNELFHSDSYLTQEVKFIESNGNLSIYLNVYGSGTANWYFRNCQRTAFADLF